MILATMRVRIHSLSYIAIISFVILLSLDALLKRSVCIGLVYISDVFIRLMNHYFPSLVFMYCEVASNIPSKLRACEAAQWLSHFSTRVSLPRFWELIKLMSLRFYFFRKSLPWFVQAKSIAAQKTPRLPHLHPRHRGSFGWGSIT